MRLGQGVVIPAVFLPPDSAGIQLRQPNPLITLTAVMLPQVVCACDAIASQAHGSCSPCPCLAPSMLPLQLSYSLLRNLTAA